MVDSVSHGYTKPYPPTPTICLLIDERCIEHRVKGPLSVVNYMTPQPLFRYLAHIRYIN